MDNGPGISEDHTPRSANIYIQSNRTCIRTEVALAPPPQVLTDGEDQYTNK